MPTPTYDLLYTTTLTTTSPLNITGISQDYRDLIVTYSSANSRNIRLNNDSTGNIYSIVTMSADGFSGILSISQNWEQIGDPNIGGSPVNTVWQIMDYSDTSKYTTILQRTSGGNYYTGAIAAIYKKTDAITAVTFYANNEIGAVISIYGIAG